MFSFFKRNPIKTLERKRLDKYREAMQAQKYGDRALQADLYAEAEAIEQQIATLRELNDSAAT